MVTSSRVLARLQLRLLHSLALSIVLLSVLVNCSLLRALSAFGTLLGFLRGGGTGLAICLVSSSVTTLLATIEGTSHLLELGKAMGDRLRGAVCRSQQLYANGILQEGATYPVQ